MSAFGEQIARDMQEVFLNGDEFAETHDLNGTKCRCIVQSPTAREQFTQKEPNNRFDGISGRVIIVHVAKESLPEVPREGNAFLLDGENTIVDTVVDDIGMLSITLHQNVGAIGGETPWP